MLKLDEKKIRKGKPVGLPYQGSKKKISKKIVEIIKQNFDADKPIYDVFGGGGAITAECVLNGLEVHYNDLDNDITDMFQRVISQDREWIKTLIISRDEFNKIRQKEPKSVDDNLKLLVNSFGNELSSYLYGADWSDTKYDLAVEIINKHDVFSGYKQTETYKKADKPYEAFSDIEGAIFYLDPPYENTTQKSYKGDFNSQAFYDWAFGMSKNNIVLISSYDISDERFECVYEFKTARSTMQGGGAGKRTEKLFMAVIT
ncbi:phage protein [Streptococcus pyogenes]|uniref:DNA adenine methylase n=1 Tax=Streptococcus pyogenes TaxID=1314 RepID=UPI00109C7EEA|nr:DNA adenine methylase [Streptococcus pyogenes]VHE30359.1 phage protein [Streptococcus pyogenes]